MHDIENVQNQPNGIWNFGHTSLAHGPRALAQPWAKGHFQIHSFECGVLVHPRIFFGDCDDKSALGTTLLLLLLLTLYLGCFCFPLEVCGSENVLRQSLAKRQVVGYVYSMQQRRFLFECLSPKGRELEGMSPRVFPNLMRTHEYTNLPLCKQLSFHSFVIASLLSHFVELFFPWEHGNI